MVKDIDSLHKAKLKRIEYFLSQTAAKADNKIGKKKKIILITNLKQYLILLYQLSPIPLLLSLLFPLI